MIIQWLTSAAGRRRLAKTTDVQRTALQHFVGGEQRLKQHHFTGVIFSFFDIVSPQRESFPAPEVLKHWQLEDVIKEALLPEPPHGALALPLVGAALVNLHLNADTTLL